MSRFVRLLTVSLVLISAVLQADEVRQQPLFKIERNKNANIVQYDARITADGTLYKKEPVTAYWIRLAEQGQKQELSWMQKTFAYGINAKLSRDRNSAELELKAEIGRPIHVQREDDSYRATADINGVQAYIEKIFIHATGSGMSTEVDYIDLHGSSIDGGAQQYERIIP